MASQPSLRIGDREREAVAAELREHYAQGRLSLDEFNQRLDAVFAARTQRDLSRITSDLPHVQPSTPLPSSGVGRRTQLASLPSGEPRPGPAVGAVWPGPVPADATWAAAGSQWQGGDWQRGRPFSRSGFGVLSTLLAALATWLLVYDVILVGLRVPFAGRIGLLIAIYTVIRGLLRRIFGSHRGRRITGMRYSGRCR